MIITGIVEIGHNGTLNQQVEGSMHSRKTIIINNLHQLSNHLEKSGSMPFLCATPFAVRLEQAPPP
jgi:hypothetical protein